jgi:hypothetical protein
MTVTIKTKLLLLLLMMMMMMMGTVITRNADRYEESLN